ncbi:MAG: DNA-J related domain-containing protein [Pseudomonadota bacterium]
MNIRDREARTARIMQPADADAFLAILREILQLHPAGLSEFDLLQRLRNDRRLTFGNERLDDPQTLFRTHFLLFHHLYRLRDELHRTRSGDLDIHALNIRLRSTTPEAPAALARPDPLSVYYLDLANLDGTSAADIDHMLGRFWARFCRYDRRGEALAVLGLPADADDDAILRQYRRLAMRHHPDRGGERARLQAINAAMAILDPRRN